MTEEIMTSMTDQTDLSKKEYVNPGCGCPHPEEEHGGCAAGPYCNHEDCRCVDGTYYGKMSDPESAKKVFESLQPEPSQNSEVLRSFVAYCYANPSQRFWQALRNWSGAAFILYVENRGYQAQSSIVVTNHDTYYREGK
jgi:hypothetical protein